MPTQGMGMYPTMPMMSQYAQMPPQNPFDRTKMQMQAMQMQPNPVGIPKPKDVMPTQQQSAIKIDPSVLQLKQKQSFSSLY
jgi:hypothetical protein